MNNSAHYLALAWISICFILSACGLESDHYADLKQASPFIVELKKKGDDAYTEEDYHAAIQSYTKAIDQLEFRVEEEIYPELLMQLGKAHFKLQNYTEALDLYQTYLQLPQVVSSPIDQAKGIGRIATIYQKIGNYKRSFDLQYQALQIMEQEQDSLGIARSFYELGSLMFYQENYEQALAYYSNSMDLVQLLGKKSSILSCLNALGVTYESLDSSELTYEYLSKALDLARELGSKGKESYTLHNIGAYYLGKQDYDQAKSYFLASYQIRVELGDQWGQAGSHIYLAKLFLETGEIMRAKKELQAALKISEDIQSNVRKAEVLKLMSRACELSGDFQESNKILNDYLDLNSTLQNEHLAKELGTIKARYEVDKKEKDDVILKEKVYQKKLKSNFFWIISFLSLGILGLSYWSFERKKFNTQLKKKNQEINLQNQELARKNDDLKKFAFVVSHDLKAPLRTIGSFSNLLRRRYFHLFDQNAQEFMDFITAGVKRMNQLLNDLLTYSQIENNEEEMEFVETKEIIEDALSNLHFEIENQNATLKIKEDLLPTVRGNASQLTQLFQNIIANGLKFRNGRDPEISINCTNAQEEQYIFAIKDNGIGIEEQYEEKIFQMFSRLHDIGQYEGTGIGLATCKKIVEKHGGNIWVESTPGEGSTFFFSLPKTFINQNIS